MSALEDLKEISLNKISPLEAAVIYLSRDYESDAALAAAELAALTQRAEKAEAERDALMYGVIWALGYTDFGIGEPDDKPAFWWRKKLIDITKITEDKISQFLRGDV